VYQVDTALEEVSKASRSVRSLSDYLYRHPESLIAGKKPAKGE
jgi:paraquat-inducible protein B